MAVVKGEKALVSQESKMFAWLLCNNSCDFLARGFFCTTSLENVLHAYGFHKFLIAIILTVESI